MMILRIQGEILGINSLSKGVIVLRLLQATFFDFPNEIRRLIYTTNSVEGYHRQVRKVTKTKGVFPTDQAVRKLLYLVTMNIAKK